MSPSEAQRPPAQGPRDRPGPGVHRGCDHRDRRDREEEEPAPVEEGRLAGHRGPREGQGHDAGEAGDLDGASATVSARRTTDHECRRERSAHEDRGGARVRPVVRACLVGGVEEPRHEDGRRHRADERDDEHRAGRPASPPRHEPDEDERPHQVELLLDRQRPRVLQRRRGLEQRPVVLVGEGGPPVRGVPDGGQRVAADLLELDRAREHDAVERDAHEQARDRQGGVAAPGAPRSPRGRSVRATTTRRGAAS